MSSPVFGFGSWRRNRSSSLQSQESQEGSDAPTVLLASPPQTTENAGGDIRQLSSSVGSAAHREPIRSFVTHGSYSERLDPVDTIQSARSVREDTEELATYFLSDKKEDRTPSFLSRNRPSFSQARPEQALLSDETGLSSAARASGSSETIEELSEPSSPETVIEDPLEGPSVLASMLNRSPPEPNYISQAKADQVHEASIVDENEDDEEELLRQPEAQEDTADPSETTPLLSVVSHQSRQSFGAQNGRRLDPVDLESQKSSHNKSKPCAARMAKSIRRKKKQAARIFGAVRDPRRWDRSALWQNLVVAPVACLPAVIVGLLLNILDALSYGMILFPLGSPIFAGLGSAGISIFYVSTIVSQITMSTGSIFRGVVGSELIEVVPFFHSMAFTITDLVGEDKPDAVIATTITSYALSSMLTGSVFYLLGKFEFGYIIGFIPRHILIGCIGGVGWFLVATGFEVSARMSGSLEYNLDTLKHLLQADTVPLWIIPLVLAIVLFAGQVNLKSRYLLPAYIVAIPILFYFVVMVAPSLHLETLRDQGWIFEGPPAGESWSYFYTLYQFKLVDWGAIVRCIPAMFALTFFGILHVPINVPALALQVGEDHCDLDHELKLHGYSNFLSGLAGSIQNYLVYANSMLFMRSGGDSRLAGFMLAALTFFVMTIGPSLIGYIPVMMVGTLIFDLGFELLGEVVKARKKLKLLENITVISIVLIMGIWDFVLGVGVGIMLAFISLIWQTSRVSAVRSSWTGDIVGSTVRRNPTQQHYLRQVGRQTRLFNLAGFLFFGTIASVEAKIRELIAVEEFTRCPTRFVILDLRQVTGLDYSAGEVFNTISRLLNKKAIVLIISGVEPNSELWRSLRAVGLGSEGFEVRLLPELNRALEFCENELLKTLYASQTVHEPHITPSTNLDVPAQPAAPQGLEIYGSSPRRTHLQEAARKSLGKAEGPRTTRWRNFKEPVRLILQIFEDLSDRNEDFWFRASRFFRCRTYPEGTVLFRRGEPADGFFLVEAGILRAEYDMPQGLLFESIVAGTTCGELPFFSETNRTANCIVERECVIWQLDKEAWTKMQREEPEIAQELLRISLKLTSERMGVITSYTLTMAC